MPIRTGSIAVLATVTVLALPTIATAGDPDVAQQLAEVRRATAQYHDVAQAVADGYEPASPCVENMGFHYLRSIAQDAGELDVATPNILVYAPRPDGRLRLVAVEYASWEPASLFGHTFDPPHGGPPFHTLHAWIWQANPSGTFSALNPNVSCSP